MNTKFNEEVPIFFAVDDNYIPFLGVALKSLMDNSSKEYKYKNQQEFRIVLNPNSPKVQSILKDGHYVYIGSLKGIISLRRCPYEGYKLKIDKQARSVEGGDLPNFWGPLHEWDLRSLLGVMKIAGRDMHFGLNGEVVGSYRFWIEIEYVFVDQI